MARHTNTTYSSIPSSAIQPVYNLNVNPEKEVKVQVNKLSGNESENEVNFLRDTNNLKKILNTNSTGIRYSKYTKTPNLGQSMGVSDVLHFVVSWPW